MKTLALLATLLLSPAVLYAQDPEPDLGTEAQRATGAALYAEYCAQCHGEDGAGDGPAAAHLRPAPRDFTSGIFKFRTTASGELPTTEDLERSIRMGMPTTSMPPWGEVFSEEQIAALAYYIKTFNDDFSGAYGVPVEVEIPDAPGFDEANVARGREVFEANQCIDCHGTLGRGDGPSAPTLEDQWGFHIRPADLTKRWTFRNGQTREDIYRTFVTGLDGSPMPSYDISEEDAWALVDYIWSLGRAEPEYATVAVAQGVDSTLDISRGAALFAAAPAAYFPVVGQVIEPGRAFQPGVNGVEVRALYNADEIAIMLVWHDMTAERSGSNSPAAQPPTVGVAPGGADTSASGASGELAANTDADVTPGAVEAAPVQDIQTLAGPPVGGVEGVSDAVAIQLPQAMPEGVERPYFLFGDARAPVDLWFADLAGDAATHFIGRGFQDIQPGTAEIDFYAAYEDGAWTAIFKRPRTADGGIPFEEGTFVPIAFSIWDGFNGERGAKRGITAWYHLYLAPMDQPSALGPMLRWGLLTLLVEIGLIVGVRRKYRKTMA